MVSPALCSLSYPHAPPALVWVESCVSNRLLYQ